MSKLKEIKIPNGVEKIESNAFRGCRSLKKYYNSRGRSGDWNACIWGM